MEYNLILIVNATAILLILLLALQLLISTKFKGENGYAAAIIVLTTIPVYFYNGCRSVEWYEAALWIAPLGFSVNTLLMPLLWLFVRRNFDPDYKFNIKKLPHFIPSLLCFTAFLVYYFSLPQSSRYDFMINENTGSDTLLGNLNAVVVFTQMFAYFTAIFIYIRKTKKRVLENLSESEWLYKMWIQTFTTLFAGLFLIVFVCYVIWPRTDAWLIQILNVLAMSYLVYHSIQSSAVPNVNSLSVREADDQTAKKEESDDSQMDTESLNIYALKAVEHLRKSEAFLNPDLTLQDLAKQMNISPKKLSRAINTSIGKNFFEIVNSLRVEKAKELLSGYKSRNLTLESVASQCGFNSNVTFSNVFKKNTGVTPGKWN